MSMTGQESQKVLWELFGQFTEEKLGELEKAKGGDRPTRDEPVSYFVNPYDYTAQTGLWRERRTQISWDTLRIVAERNPIISAIINTRVNQIGTFSSSARILEATGNNPLGYKIVPRQKDKKLTDGEEKYIIELEDFIWKCGFTDKSSAYSRDNFDGWLRKITRDSLSFDATATELIPTNRGGVAEFFAVDAATIRMSATKQQIADDEELSFVQILNGDVVARYRANEIMYGIRNPTTAIKNNGYGISEIEQLMGVVTNIFNAMTHNAMFFKNGAAVKGLINIKPNSKGGGAPASQVEAFKRAWRAMVTGADNAWSTPILQSDGVEFVNMGSTNREMEFHLYLEFLVKIACAVYAIDPGEINFFLSGASGGSSPLFEDSHEAKLKMSKDKGLRPLLSAISRWINQFIIAPISEEYVFSFVGIDSKNEKDIIDLRKTEGSAYKTLDEIREEAGLSPLGADEGGDLILNPQYMQFKQQQAMEAMQGGLQEGPEGGPEVEAPEDGGGQKVKERGRQAEALKAGAVQMPGSIRKGEGFEKSVSRGARGAKYIKITID
jgi:hypothetical protein